MAMNFRTAQKIADRPDIYTLMERCEAFAWAHRKAGDRKLSAEYRDKCHEIAKAIWRSPRGD